jgi:SOS-response transcriptional repressor LexA
MHNRGMDINTIRLDALRREIRHFPTLVAFARKYGLDSTYLSQLLNGHRNLGEKAARNLEAKLGWPPRSMDRSVDEPGEEADGYDRPPPGLRRVPRISFVQAGVWTEAVDPYALGAGDDYLLTQLDLGAHAFALTVRGESMEPEFKEGDSIIIDPDVKPSPGDFVVAKNAQEEATFKKYRPRGINEQGEQVIELVPLNDDFPSLRSDYTPLQIIGTMMEHRRYRKPR